MLLQRLEQHGNRSSNLFALFISNPPEMVPFWYQRASSHQDGFVIWDYHVSTCQKQQKPPCFSSPLVRGQPCPLACQQVIALEMCPQQSGVLVWDLDLQHPTLQFPCTLQQYAQHALQADSIELPPQYARYV